MNVIFKRILLLCLSTIAVCILAELYFRYIYDASDFFYHSNTSEAWKKKHVQLNSLGFRDVNHTLPESAATSSATQQSTSLKIAFIGDSFTYGQGIVHTSDRFSDIVGKEIKKMYPNSEYFNLGMPGWSTVDEIEYLTHASKLPKFDVIIFQYFIDDIEGRINYVKGNSALYAYGYLGKTIFSKSTNAFIDILRSNSYFFDFVYNQHAIVYYSKHTDFQKLLADKYDALRTWNKLTAQFDQIGGYKMKNNTKVLIVLFPSMANLDNKYYFASYHNKITDYLRFNGIDSLDLYPYFQGYDTKKLTVNIFDQHPSMFANHLAAQEILSKIMPMLPPRAK